MNKKWAKLLFVTTAMCGFATNAWCDVVAKISSPDKSIEVTLEQNSEGVVQYSISRFGNQLIAPSSVNFNFETTGQFGKNLAFDGAKSKSKNETWELPWGESRYVLDKHNELAADFSEKSGAKRRFSVIFSVFDDGVGFRYSFPNKADEKIGIIDEFTEFKIAPEATAWWIKGGEINSHELLYNKTKLSELTRAHTPMTIKTKDGVYMSFHEAGLSDYSGMMLSRIDGQTLRSELEAGTDGVKVRKTGPFMTPWRTIRIADTAGGLYESNLELNLNEPNKLGNVSWVKPFKYVGVWWEMHLDIKSWASGAKHGATTQNVKRFIDFAAQNGFKGVLVEGWNEGWDGDWVAHGDKFKFDKPYPDFDADYLAKYAKSKGVFIIGHNETSGNICNYEAQLDKAMDYAAQHLIPAIKTGYVQDDGGMIACDNGVVTKQWHDNQRIAQHHIKVLKAAALRKISIDSHEPIKDTGLRRTYPNWVSREGARGQEYNAWGVPPNPPEHEPNLIFTRMLSGPMDFTPGVLSLRGRNNQIIENTIARQLALYVVLYSPIQMAADLPENYEKHKDAFQFIKDVPVDWQKSKVLSGEIGDYAVIARQDRNSNNWFVGGVSDENGRKVNLNFSFLDPKKKYIAEIYRDGDGADYRTNQFALAIEKKKVDVTSNMDIVIAPGGGFAIAIKELK